jgi:hypothetical protein
MRTTVNIDDNLLAEAKVLAAKTSKSLGTILDDALRAMLRSSTRADARPAFVLPTHGKGGLQPGVDLDDQEALAELMGDNAAP